MKPTIDRGSVSELAVVFIAICLLFFAVAQLKNFLIPICWAAFFSLMILPVVKWLDKGIKYKSFNIAICITLLIIIAAGLLYLTGVEIVGLSRELPKLTDNMYKYMKEIREYTDQHIGIPYSEQPTEIIDRLSNWIQKGLGMLTNTISDTFTVITMIGLIPVYMFLILYYRHRIFHFISIFYKRERSALVKESISKISNVVHDYILGLVIDTIIVAILTFFCFYFLGIKHALFFSVFVAFMNLIPYLGAVIATVFATAYVLVVKDGFFYPIMIFLLLSLVQLIENNLIKPLVVGKKIRLNPFTVFLSVIVGGMIWGASGMILFIPIIGAIKIIMDQIESLKPFGFLLGDKELE